MTLRILVHFYILIPIFRYVKYYISNVDVLNYVVPYFQNQVKNNIKTIFCQVYIEQSHYTSEIFFQNLDHRYITSTVTSIYPTFILFSIPAMWLSLFS